ncbi:glycoside hydrolase family 25 protein [Paenibacillus sp. NEAU-GSW1]|uniref:glycoside hydrolase family 25 protein n=1 Tax=Paenibacillus sp. NEAU-GSW1 TaxID=2682486 RepID=UPI0012E1FEDA|nr:glycoside hydrolase family 25 protein [Paenibacillus sp. NEAU-GSW1]MUT65264.1 1,4-beta-N-acetylmuramidase [Paenibacillus sp. NEAU-GSW1]
MQSRSSGNAQGIDVSHYQGSINWQKVKADGIVFAFAKASEGQSYRDDRFAANVAGARDAGVLIGAYHFVNATSTEAAKQEANNFACAIADAGGISLLDLPPVMDYENNPGGLSGSEISAVAKAFLSEVENLVGVKPIVYTGNSFASNFDSSLGDYELWIARYSSSQVPSDTAAWSKWTFWQYSDGSQGGYRPDGTRSVDGIGGPVDLNEYDGTEQELRDSYKGDEPMTDDEKLAFDQLSARVADLEKFVNISGNQVPPSWAQPALDAALEAGIITTVNDKGEPELVTIQMLYNAGLLNSELVAFFKEFSVATRKAIEDLEADK